MRPSHRSTRESGRQGSDDGDGDGEIRRPQRQVGTRRMSHTSAEALLMGSISVSASAMPPSLARSGGSRSVEILEDINDNYMSPPDTGIDSQQEIISPSDFHADRNEAASLAESTQGGRRGSGDGEIRRPQRQGGTRLMSHSSSEDLLMERVSVSSSSMPPSLARSSGLRSVEILEDNEREDGNCVSSPERGMDLQEENLSPNDFREDHDEAASSAESTLSSFDDVGKEGELADNSTRFTGYFDDGGLVPFMASTFGGVSLDVPLENIDSENVDVEGSSGSFEPLGASGIATKAAKEGAFPPRPQLVSFMTVRLDKEESNDNPYGPSSTTAPKRRFWAIFFRKGTSQSPASQEKDINSGTSDPVNANFAARGSGKGKVVHLNPPRWRKGAFIAFILFNFLLGFLVVLALKLWRSDRILNGLSQRRGGTPPTKATRPQVFNIGDLVSPGPVPRRPPNLADSCSPSAVLADQSFYERCRSVCNAAECCFLPRWDPLSCQYSREGVQPECVDYLQWCHTLGNVSPVSNDGPLSPAG